MQKFQRLSITPACQDNPLCTDLQALLNQKESPSGALCIKSALTAFIVLRTPPLRGLVDFENTMRTVALLLGEPPTVHTWGYRCRSCTCPRSPRYHRAARASKSPVCHRRARGGEIPKNLFGRADRNPGVASHTYVVDPYHPGPHMCAEHQILPGNCWPVC